MARAVLLLLLIVAVVSISASPAEKKCGENEQYNTCGSSCPATCQNPDSSAPCTLACVIDCECKDGYVRNAQNKCVLTQDC